MYFECFAQSFFAGFYVGAYGLVANFSAPARRAQRFARMDAVSLLAITFSVAVSIRGCSQRGSHQARQVGWRTFPPASVARSW